MAYYMRLEHMAVSVNSVFKGGHLIVTCQIRLSEWRSITTILAKTTLIIILSELPLSLTVLSVFLQFIRWVILGVRSSHCRPDLCLYLSQLPCTQIIFTWRHIIHRSLEISLAFLDLPYFLFFVHKRQYFRKNVRHGYVFFFYSYLEFFKPAKNSTGCHRTLLAFVLSHHYDLLTKSEGGRRIM